MQPRVYSRVYPCVKKIHALISMQRGSLLRVYPCVSCPCLSFFCRVYLSVCISVCISYDICSFAPGCLIAWLLAGRLLANWIAGRPTLRINLLLAGLQVSKLVIEAGILYLERQFTLGQVQILDCGCVWRDPEN